MSLRYWLPLVNNATNQGLTGDVTTVMGSGITYTAGKLGTAATFPNNPNSCLRLPKLNLQTGSWCCWFKVLGTGADANYQYMLSDGRDNNGGGTNIRLNSAGTSIYTDSHKVGISQSISLNTWYHIAITFGDNLFSLYLNGELIHSVSYSENTDYTYSDGFVIGKMSKGYTATGSYFPFNGQINDVRVYDNRLSDKEIKEIAKGLVLHYKLDTLENNLLYSTPKSVASTSYCGYQLNLTENLVADQTYTLQLWDVDVYHSAKTAAQTGIWIYWGGGSVHLLNWAGPTYFTADGDTNYHADYLVKTFTVTSSQASGSGAANAWFNVYNSVGYVEGTLRMHIGNWKLEKGSIAHPMAFASNQIFDCSGYNHHGEVLNNPSVINDTARFNNALHFSATNQKVKISNFPTSGFGNSYSFAWWEKISSVTPMHWGFADGIRLNGMYTGRLWNTGDSSNNPLYEPGTTTQVAAPTVNVWHHWVMTGDGTSCKVYQDGVLWAQAKTYKAISGTTIFLNGWTQNTDYSSDNASISDFRIYATALSEEDISDLYHTPFSIDNKGNGYAREVIEDTSLNITKTGQFYGNEMLDDNSFTTASITKDDHQLKVNTLYEH